LRHQPVYLDPQRTQENVPASIANVAQDVLDALTKIGPPFAFDAP
jgi:hypothetical protein